jgi:hypothetical protein
MPAIPQPRSAPTTLSVPLEREGDLAGERETGDDPRFGRHRRDAGGAVSRPRCIRLPEVAQLAHVDLRELSAGMRQ